LTILEEIQCGTEQQGRQIEDEDDMRNHLGSLIQFSEREKLERIVDMNVKVGNFDAAIATLSEKLLELMPDQWSYWKDLMKYSLNCHDNDFQSSFEQCSLMLERVLKKQDGLDSDGKGPRVSLRGPHLFRIHMIATGISQFSTSEITGLCEAIITYCELFAPSAICCFQDLSPFIDLLVQKSCLNGEISEDVLRLIKSTKRLREKNDPRLTAENINDKRQRREKLRAYIASIKICFETWYQLLQQIDRENESLRKSIDQSFEGFIPSGEELVKVWEHVLDLGSNPNDGGQKETLPGDDLILLGVQLLFHQIQDEDYKESEKAYIFAACILDKAISQSPYNPYLKMCALNVYMKIGAPSRAWQIFEDLQIRHIQLDSCSYFILRHLINNGLYKECIGQAGKIITLHSISANDVVKFMPKSFENGYLMKGLEMIDWQRREMKQSLQLLEAKGLIMDLAPLLSSDDAGGAKLPSPLGAMHGLCGGSADLVRAEKIARDSSNYYAAPSIQSLSIYGRTHLQSEKSNDEIWSDNRDLSLNDFEILEKTNYTIPVEELLGRAHIHAILTRIVLLVDGAKAPKKGKVAKYAKGDLIDIRSESLLQTMKNADEYLNSHNGHALSDVHVSLWKATLSLCRVMCILSAGKDSLEAQIPTNDSLAKREERCVKVLDSVRASILDGFEALKAKVSNEKKASDVDKFNFICKILAEILVPFHTTLNTTATLFALFSWGKRKRDTRPAVGALAGIAMEFRVILEDIINELMELPSSVKDESYKMSDIVSRLKEEGGDGDKSSVKMFRVAFFATEEGTKVLDRVIGFIALNKCSLRRRMEPFLKQMVDEMNSFDATE